MTVEDYRAAEARRRNIPRMWNAAQQFFEKKMYTEADIAWGAFYLAADQEDSPYKGGGSGGGGGSDNTFSTAACYILEARHEKNTGVRVHEDARDQELLALIEEIQAFDRKLSLVRFRRAFERLKAHVERQPTPSETVNLSAGIEIEYTVFTAAQNFRKTNPDPWGVFVRAIPYIASSFPDEKKRAMVALLEVPAEILEDTVVRYFCSVQPGREKVSKAFMDPNCSWTDKAAGLDVLKYVAYSAENIQQRGPFALHKPLARPLAIFTGHDIARAEQMLADMQAAAQGYIEERRQGQATQSPWDGKSFPWPQDDLHSAAQVLLVIRKNHTGSLPELAAEMSKILANPSVGQNGPAPDAPPYPKPP